MSSTPKTSLRIIACAPIALTVYSFASLIAILCLERGLDEIVVDGQRGFAPLDKGELVRAVERTRMLLSTMTTFVTTNAERAFKAVDDYTKGKLVKKILLQKQSITR